jgi:toxin ParE1/3/4
MADYQLSVAAQNDLVEITKYTALNFGTRQAIKYTDQIYDAARLIAESPRLGRLFPTTQRPTLRRYNVGSHSLFYQPEDQGVLIVRLLHQAMDFDQHLG